MSARLSLRLRISANRTMTVRRTESPDIATRSQRLCYQAPEARWTGKSRSETENTVRAHLPGAVRAGAAGHAAWFRDGRRSGARVPRATAWLYTALGVGGLVLGVVLLGTAAIGGLRWHREVARRRGGRYSAAELSRLDDRGLTVAATRMLRRDGWHVVDVGEPGRPRLYASRQGRQLDVGFRPVDSADEGGSGFAPLREVGRPGPDGLLRVVVHRGDFSRADVLWASRQGGVLLDGNQLGRWAAGSRLDELGL